MENEEHQQKRTEFEATLTELPDADKTTKLAEWDQQNPLPPKPDDNEDYRSKLNIQNRFLEKEGYEFKDGKWTKPAVAPTEDKPAPSASTLTPEDALVLAKADVHEDDLQSVLKWAKDNETTVAKALKDKDLGIILAAHAEERRTAAATQTGGGARGASQASGTVLLAKARQTGEVPETTEGMNAIFLAKQQEKAAGRKR